MTNQTATFEESAAPVTHRWTRDQYERAIEAGIFDPKDHLELILGEITDKMSPQNSPHSAAIGAMQDALDEAFPSGYWVRVQLPLALSHDSEPEPDLAVVRGSWRDYTQSQPTTAIMVVEISDTTLALDRTVKASIYAQAGIAEYWIVNLRNRMLEIYRQPTADPAEPLRFHYQSISHYNEAQIVSPLSAPDISIAVINLLP